MLLYWEEKLIHVNIQLESKWNKKEGMERIDEKKERTKERRMDGRTVTRT